MKQRLFRFASNGFVVGIVLGIAFIYMIEYVKAYQSPKLGIELMAPGEAQAFITFNDMLYRMDALMFPTLKDYPANVSPDLIVDATEGDLFIVPADAEGEWATKEDYLAYRQNAAWQYIIPATGMIVDASFALHDGFLIQRKIGYSGAEWNDIGGIIQNHGFFGTSDPGTYASNDLYTFYDVVILHDITKSFLGALNIRAATTEQQLILLKSSAQMDAGDILVMSATTGVSARISGYSHSFLQSNVGFGGELIPEESIHSFTNIRADGVFNVDGTAGFTGTGAYTNFTIQGGIITNAN
jgi:hypothetical protein